MTNAIEDAAFAHIREKSPASLRELYMALLSGTLLVPLAADLKTDHAGRTDVPARCIRLADGQGCLPVFTSETRLLEWQPMGAKFAEMSGPALFNMVTAMPEVDAIFVNYSEQTASPKGSISRPEFDLLAQGICPTNNP
jgi:hypothetical protein